MLKDSTQVIVQSDYRRDFMYQCRPYGTLDLYGFQVTNIMSLRDYKYLLWCLLILYPMGNNKGHTDIVLLKTELRKRLMEKGSRQVIVQSILV